MNPTRACFLSCHRHRGHYVPLETSLPLSARDLILDFQSAELCLSYSAHGSVCVCVLWCVAVQGSRAKTLYILHKECYH